MYLTLLKGKLHGGTVTDASLEYEGSIGIDQDLMDAAGFLPNERVDVWNITNGARFSTYTIAYPRGSKALVINGAAAHISRKGDKIIIAAFVAMQPDAAEKHTPRVVILNPDNSIKK